MRNQYLKLGDQSVSHFLNFRSFEQMNIRTYKKLQKDLYKHMGNVDNIDTGHFHTENHVFNHLFDQR